MPSRTMVAEALDIQPACAHCGLPIPPGPKLFATIRGLEAPMCCLGCRAVAEMIQGAGLGAWYERREGPTGKRAVLSSEMLGGITYLESEAFAEEFVDRPSADTAAADFLVDGLRCAACVWVIERHLSALQGIQTVRVSLASHRVHVEWTHDQVALRDVIERLAEIGFAARPDRPGARDERDRRENRDALIRLGVAGLGAMNVMTYAVALYMGGFDGMSAGSQALMRWLAWLVTTPIVFISARPFFVGAWHDLSRRAPGMDVPVALAIGGAYVVSAIATVSGTGEVYFDSVCMFTFFLSLGRYLEQRVQRRCAAFVREMSNATPAMARRVEESGFDEDALETVVPARALRVGDQVRVLAGEAVPADGVVLEGQSALNEALLTGEVWPREVSAGDVVVAGSQNVDQSLLIRATRVGSETTLAAIVALVEQAGAERAPVARNADRVARYFVTIVLGIALVNAVAWSAIAPERAIWTTLAVLVATCPCALSLATPMALGSSCQGLAQAGLLITRAGVLETLASVDRFVFDKTGTLTQGEPTLSIVLPRAGHTADEVTRIARQLEGESAHPLAHAFREKALSASREMLTDKRQPKVSERRSYSGAGVEGFLDGRRYRLGRPDWASEGQGVVPPAALAREECVQLLLSDDEGTLAWFGLEDQTRAGASQMIEALTAKGIEVEMLSGDPSPAASALATRLGLVVACPAAMPEEKLERVRALQARGERIGIVADGVNDSPSIRAADVSIAMGTGCDLTRLNADAVLLKDDLSLIPLAHDWARRTQRIISQNLAWAIAYNVLALPLAVSGTLAPWMAAIGMSTSSLVVVLNAARLRKPVCAT